MKHNVYSVYQINLIVFFTSSFMFIPILMVFAYLFDLHLIMSTNRIILIADIMAILYLIGGLLSITLSKQRSSRKLKPSYQKEFSFVLVISAFGILGFGILFTYLGGRLFYVPHVIIPIALFTYIVLFILGDKYFNTKMIKK